MSNFGQIDTSRPDEAVSIRNAPHTDDSLRHHIKAMAPNVCQIRRRPWRRRLLILSQGLAIHIDYKDPVVSAKKNIRVGLPILESHHQMPTSLLMDLTTISGVQGYLARKTSFTSHTITQLAGGSTNFAYRIHLVAPFDGKSTLVVKHAQPYVKGLPGVAFGLERQVSSIWELNYF